MRYDVKDWKQIRLGDLVAIKHGWPFKSADFSEQLSGCPIVVNIGNFRYTGGFRFDSTTVKEYRDTYPQDYELRPDDILLVMTCQTADGEILGIPDESRTLAAIRDALLPKLVSGEIHIKNAENAVETGAESLAMSK